MVKYHTYSFHIWLCSKHIVSLINVYLRALIYHDFNLEDDIQLTPPQNAIIQLAAMLAMQVTQWLMVN